jgi:hypothetical protein
MDFPLQIEGMAELREGESITLQYCFASRHRLLSRQSRNVPFLAK